MQRVEEKTEAKDAANGKLPLLRYHDLREDEIAEENQNTTFRLSCASYSPQRDAALRIFLFFAIGIPVYMFYAELSFLNAFYFCVVTLTTVGYGDTRHSGNETGVRVWSCFYILVAIVLIAASLSSLFEHVMKRQTAAIISLVKDKNRTQENREEAANPSIFKRKDFRPFFISLIFLLSLCGLGTYVYAYTHKPALSFTDACYFTIVTITTVGYGDIVPNSSGAKLFSIIFLPLSTLSLAHVITQGALLNTQTQQKKV